LNKIAAPRFQIVRFFPVVFLITFVFIVAANAKANSPAAAQKSDEYSAVDVRGVRHYAQPNKQASWIAEARQGFPPPLYFYRKGIGVFRLLLDPERGKVVKIISVRSTGFRELDDFAIDWLRRWHWKPGTWKEVDIPIEFTRKSGSRDSGGSPFVSHFPGGFSPGPGQLGVAR
jgi:TonB family protein